MLPQLAEQMNAHATSPMTAPPSIVAPNSSHSFLLPTWLPTAPDPTTRALGSGWKSSVRSPQRPPTQITSRQTNQTPFVFLPGIWKQVYFLTLTKQRHVAGSHKKEIPIKTAQAIN